MKLASIFAFAVALTYAPFTIATTVPGASSPLFYLVASSKSWTNLLPVRFAGNNGYPGGGATLLGGGSPVQLYFRQDELVAKSSDGSDSHLRLYINSSQDKTGCPNFGPFGFLAGYSTNKCTKYSVFEIQEGERRLGSKLVFNYSGGFYSCGGGQQIYYKDTPSRQPNNCEPITLWTVPVAC